MRPALHLVPIYCAGGSPWIDALAKVLSRVFGMSVSEHPPRFDPEQAFDPARGQYDSRVLLARLLEETPDDVDRVLGVVGVDLFIPILTFVFGEAQLDGRAAVVSTHRLRPEAYGLPPDEDLLFRRLCKEAIHELGHTYALLHCHETDCVMASSTYVEGIDLKSERFCAGCATHLRR